MGESKDSSSRVDKGSYERADDPGLSDEKERVDPFLRLSDEKAVEEEGTAPSHDPALQFMRICGYSVLGLSFYFGVLTVYLEIDWYYIPVLLFIYSGVFLLLIWVTDEQVVEPTFFMKLLKAWPFCVAVFAFITLVAGYFLPPLKGIFVNLLGNEDIE